MRRLLAALLGISVFDVMQFLVVAVVLLSVGYDIYIHQALLDPKEVGMAKVEITGTGHFRGGFGTERDTYVVEGGAPATVEVPFAQSDFIEASLERLPGSTQILPDSVQIKVGKKVVDEGDSAAMWRVPRDFAPNHN